jgi:hypothetical protein
MVMRHRALARARRWRMHGRKRAATVVIAALGAIGLALPGTAAARGFPPIGNWGVANTSMVVDVSSTSTGSSSEVVSWSDAVECVSWGD